MAAVLAGCAGTPYPAAFAPERRPGPAAAVLWSRNLGREVQAAPVPVGEDWVVVLPREVFRLRGADGKRVWRARFADPLAAVPVRTQGVVVVSTADPGRTVEAVGVGDGKRRWRREGAGPGLGAGGGVLVTVDAAGVLVRRDPETGDELWSRRLPGAAGRSPVLVAGEMVLVPVRPDSLAAVEADSGRVRWVRRVGFAPRAAESETGIVVTVEDGSLLLLDPADGSGKAKVSLPGLPAGDPVVRGARVAVATSPGRLLCFTLPELEPAWERDLGPPLVAGPATDGRLLWQVARNGRAIGLRWGDGTRVAFLTHPERLAVPVGVGAGAVLVAGGGGEVTAYRLLPAGGEP